MRKDLHITRVKFFCGSAALVCLAVVSLARVAVASEALSTSSFKRVMFVGNSITKHGPSKKVDWTGNWGMAASCEEKDYVHIVLAGLTEKGKIPPVSLIKNAAAFERGYKTFDVDKGLKDVFEFGADLVIIALGENVKGFKSEEDAAFFKNCLKTALLRIKERSNPRIVIRSCFWASKAKDDILKEIADEVGGRFVDISALDKDELNFARSERDYTHKGVAGHPGDKGMQAIADAILAGVKAE
jgi:hypothetical protein